MRKVQNYYKMTLGALCPRLGRDVTEELLGGEQMLESTKPLHRVTTSHKPQDYY